jgi:mono/diheme cytochrome c family protein
MKAIVIAVAVGLALGAWPGAAQTSAGDSLYRQYCRACHGTTGAPPASMRTVFKSLPTLDSAFVAARSQDSLAAVIRNGAGRDMKGFKDKLTPEQILAIAKHVKTFAIAAKGP